VTRLRNSYYAAAILLLFSSTGQYTVIGREITGADTEDLQFVISGQRHPAMI